MMGKRRNVGVTEADVWMLMHQSASSTVSFALTAGHGENAPSATRGVGESISMVD